MAEKEIKIGFPEVKMEALEFFLKENNTTAEDILKEYLDKTYEKNVPQQVRKFVESRIEPQAEEVVRTEDGSQRNGRGQARRSQRQNAARDTVQEQESGDMPVADGQEVQETEQDSGMIMGM